MSERDQNQAFFQENPTPKQVPPLTEQPLQQPPQQAQAQPFAQTQVPLHQPTTYAYGQGMPTPPPYHSAAQANPHFPPQPQPPYPPFHSQTPPLAKPKGTVSKTVFGWSIFFSILLTACFTIGLMYALNFFAFLGRNYNNTNNGPIIVYEESETNGSRPNGEGSNPAGQNGSDLTVEEIILDGISIKVEPNANWVVKEKAKKLGQMLSAVKNNYYRELTTAEILEAMIAGVPSNLDSPYSYYMTAEEFASMQESNSGHYSGIGARISQNLQGNFELIDITPDSPAEESGLQPGDIIIAVDGEDSSNFANVTALANSVKGAEGTKVTISIYRPSEAREFDAELTRRTIESVYITHRMLDKNIGYLSISEFSSSMPEQFEIALKDLVAKGAKNIVFDLRNNPGGDAYAVQQVLDMLLPEGVVASVKGRDQGEYFEETWTSRDGQLVPADMKFAVLVNANSASASELFAGAMRDRVGAEIIGQQTFGKGSGTRFYTLEDGSAVNVTIFLYYFPNGETPEKVGITPTIEVELPDSALGKVISRLTPEEDTQLAEAIKVLSP